MDVLVGLLIGEEETFPAGLTEELGRRGIEAESLSLGGLQLDSSLPHSLVVDRVSHRVEFYRRFLQSLVIHQGLVCINDPIKTALDHRFAQRQRAARLGMKVPRSVLLPTRDYPEGVGPDTLTNLVYPLPWTDILEYVGLPAAVRITNSRKPLHRVHHLMDLWEAYGKTGRSVAELVQLLEAERHVYCYVFGKESVAVEFDPVTRKPKTDKSLTAKIEKQACRLAKKLVAESGYVLAGVEFAQTSDGLYFLDLDPFVELEWWSVGEEIFSTAVQQVADLIEGMTRGTRKSGRKQLIKG